MKAAVSGPFAELDFYTDCQFICIAWQFGSKLAYVSAFLFILSNILMQLVFFTWVAVAYGGNKETDKRGRSNSTFKPRSFDVLHEVILTNALARGFERACCAA